MFKVHGDRIQRQFESEFTILTCDVCGVKDGLYKRVGIDLKYVEVMCRSCAMESCFDDIEWSDHLNSMYEKERL